MQVSNIRVDKQMNEEFNKMIKSAEASNNSNYFLWILFSSICVPLTVPWLIYKLFKRFHLQRKYSSLSNKVVLITGASSGLGEALAHAFYKHGCRLILASRRKEELERVKNDLLKYHANVLTHPPVVLTLDLSDINSLPGRISSVLQIYQQIDILINNGGISYRGSVIDTSVDVDIKIMLTNYFGQVALTKAVLPSMIAKRSGHVVAISSVQGRIAIPQRSAYAASKHAFQAFCDSLRAEVADNGIKVTVINPGYIKTNLSLNALTNDGKKYGVMDQKTSQGYPADFVAKKIVDSVVAEDSEMTLANVDARIAIFLRTVIPSLYFWIMNKRANKKTE